MAKFQSLRVKSEPSQNLKVTATVPGTGSFSWEEHIAESGDRPAPKTCFRQATIPPENEFTPGMKLESRDPRNSMSICIATVIYTSGSRLCLRLDGSDNRNDFWSLVDSEDIHPYGWCESKGEQLQPPLGFAKNASCYPVFLNKLLQESMSMMAPKSCFKPAPPHPEKNKFEVGMKLEAIDRKNPHLIGPATVGDIDGDKIYVQFDGWRGAFDYWCRYDSRDIFYVGWCALAGHPIQPPGTKGIDAVAAGNITHNKGPGSTKSQSASPNLAIHIETQSPSVGIPSPGSAKSTGSKRHSPAVNKLILSPEPSTLSPASAGVETVTAYVNQNCHCGPQLIRTRIFRLPLQYGPTSVTKLLKKVVQALVDSAVNPTQVFHNLVSSPSNIIITTKVPGKTLTCSIPAVVTASAFTQYISNLLQQIECCVNLISLQPLQQICDKCSTNSSGSSHPLRRANSSTNGHSPSKRGRTMRTLSVPAKSRSRKAYSNVQETPLLASPHIESLAGISSMHPAQPAVSTNPENWTTDEVLQYIRSNDPTLSKQAHLIQSNEIDGRAFLLMTSDIAIKYMHMKVGPALKLCSLIDQLRTSMRY